MNRYTVSLFLITILFLSACNDAEIGSAKDVDPDTIYLDYRISGEEGNDDATVLLQYRFAGKNGTTLTIDAPGKVELDGEAIKVDSTKMTGAFYELQKPVANFKGQHTIRFTNLDKKVYEEKFEFPFFTIADKFPDTLSRKQFGLLLTGLKENEVLDISLSDTSYTGDGVLRKARLESGKLVITDEDIAKLASGPIQFEIAKETAKPVKNATPEGGKIVVMYTIRREFWLRD